MKVQELGAILGFHVLQFRGNPFATVDASKHGFNTFNMSNVSWEISRREDKVIVNGKWNRYEMSS